MRDAMDNIRRRDAERELDSQGKHPPNWIGQENSHAAFEIARHSSIAIDKRTSLGAAAVAVLWQSRGIPCCLGEASQRRGCEKLTRRAY